MHKQHPQNVSERGVNMQNHFPEDAQQTNRKIVRLSESLSKGTFTDNTKRPTGSALKEAGE